jgi:hypothetical protein
MLFYFIIQLYDKVLLIYLNFFKFKQKEIIIKGINPKYRCT